MSKRIRGEEPAGAPPGGHDPAAALLALGDDEDDTSPHPAAAAAAAAEGVECSSAPSQQQNKRARVDDGHDAEADDGAIATAAAAAEAAILAAHHTDTHMAEMPPLDVPHHHGHEEDPEGHSHMLDHHDARHHHQDDHHDPSSPGARGGGGAGAASRDDKWQEMFDMLVAYKAEKGDCLVPGRYGKLGPWVQIQRAQYRLLREGKPTNLTNDRVARLESVGFTWQILKDRDECWTDMYNELLRYREEHGHTNVPSTSKDHSKLGSWCKRQRMTHRLLKEGKASPMKAEWVVKLEGIGFDFDGVNKRSPPTKDDDENFSTRIEEVKQFVSENGHCLIPENYPANEALGKWAAQKRKQKKRIDEGKATKLSPDRIKQLDDLGFVWQVWGNRTEKWEEMFLQLKAYKERTGSCRVPLKDTDNRKLGMWVDRQKTNYRLKQQGSTSPMTDERIEKLEDIGFEWQVTDREYEADSWNKRLEELKAYKEANGDCLVPRNYEENKKLGRWVDHQRQQYRNMQKGTLHYMSKEKLKKLEDVGFVFAPPPANLDTWTKYFNKLTEYKEANGNCRVPYTYPKDPGLGTWVETLRTQYWRLKRGRSSRLTDDRIKLLENLGMEWEVAPEEGRPSSKPTGRGSWDTRFEELSAYKDEHGDCNVPNNYPQNKKLGSFVKKQREDYRIHMSGKHSPMNQERIKRLESIGFAWTVVDREYYHDSWTRRFEELKEFKAQHGHCFVPRQFPENQKLAYWVERQRQDYRNLQSGKPSKMTQDRVGVLEEVGFHWSVKDQKRLGIPPVGSTAKPAAVRGSEHVLGAEEVTDADVAEAIGEAVAQAEAGLQATQEASV